MNNTPILLCMVSILPLVPLLLQPVLDGLQERNPQLLLLLLLLLILLLLHQLKQQTKNLVRNKQTNRQH